MLEPIIALVALSLMEIVLGIDNIVFISILTAKLPAQHQSAGRRLGLLFALVTRIALLSCIFWIAHSATEPLLRLSDYLPMEFMQSYFEEDSGGGHSLSHGFGGSEDADDEPAVLDVEAWEEFVTISWRDIILLGGGIFLIWNSVREIHFAVEGEEDQEAQTGGGKANFAAVIVQIGIMDIVFSLDSVITAVGMADHLWVMIAAVILAVGVMILFADQVGDFVERNPTIRMLALSFLLLIGVMLVAEGIGTPIAKGYIYFAMAFSLLVESFNMRIRNRAETAEA